MLSASGLDALISTVSQTVEVSHRVLRLEDSLQHDFVEDLLLDLAFCCGLGHHCLRTAGPSVSLGSAGGSSELPSVLLLLCDHAAPGSLLNRLGMLPRSNRQCWKGQMRQADMCVVHLQVTRLLRAKVAPTCGNKSSTSKRYIGILLRLILNLPGFQQSLSLGINPIFDVELCFPHDNIVDSHSCDECKKSNELSVLTQTLVHFVTARATLFTNQRMSSLPMLAKYKHFLTI